MAPGIAFAGTCYRMDDRDDYDLATRGQFYRGKQTHDMGKLDIQVNVGCRAVPVQGIERAGRREGILMGMRQVFQGVASAVR